MIRFWPSTIIVLCLLFGHSSILSSTSFAIQSRASISKVVDDAVNKEMERQKIVGASVGLIIKSRVVHTKGYGFADVEAGVPFTENTVINWASNSKPVMAVLALQLAQNGKLDLDQTIDNYLTDLPSHLQSITTRHLLCHQSGIPHYSNGKIVRGDEFDPSKDESDPLVALNRFLPSPLIFEPGKKKDYSSYAYILLSAVVQAAGEQPIARQILSRIKEPLKLDSFQLDVPFNGQENWSKAYRINDKGRAIEIEDKANFWKHGAGAYKSNVKDFATFARALMKARLINVRTSVQMMTPQSTNNGDATKMGLGVYISGTGDSLKVWHNGSQDETRTRMVIFPNRRHGVVVMCNCRHADPGKISTAIYSALRKYKIKY